MTLPRAGRFAKTLDMSQPSNNDVENRRIFTPYNRGDVSIINDPPWARKLINASSSMGSSFSRRRIGRRKRRPKLPHLLVIKTVPTLHRMVRMLHWTRNSREYRRLTILPSDTSLPSTPPALNSPCALDTRRRVYDFHGVFLASPSEARGLLL